MINNVVLNGRLTRDPELRYTPSGVAVATFTVAVDRAFKNQNGEREADFINCVIWRKAAENFANFTHKGSRVGVQGRLQTRSYENQQGQRVYVTEVVCENFDLLETRAESEQYRQNNGGNAANFNNTAATPQNNQNVGGQMGAANANPFTQNNAPANNPTSNNAASNNAADPFAGGNNADNISDDDLPF